MIAKLRQILGLQTVQEKLERYALLKGEMDEINERTDFLAEEYISRLNGYNTLLKSDCSPEIKDSVQKRYANFMDGQKKQVIGLVNQRHKVEKSIASILKDEKIKDAVSEFELLEKAKSNYKSGIISKGVYNDIIKAKKGKVHYSDNFVFWNNKLLLIQRATDDNGANKWCLPGGHVDAGETHEQAAIRELQEETGLVVENPILAGTYRDDNAMIEYYTSTIESDTEPQLVLDTAEHQSYKWVDLHKEGIDEFEFPFNMKENIKKLLLPKEEKPQDISKAVNMFIEGFISKDVLSDIVKARSGIYKDTPENRKLGRVGQRYGGKKESEKKETKETDFSYSNKDFLLAVPEDDGKDIESTINEFVSNITGDKSDRVGSQYYRTGKKIEGKDVVIRVSDHSHSERNVLGSEYLVSIVVDEDESSHSRVEDDYSELVVSERNMDDALEVIQEFFDKVEAGHKKTVSKSLTDLFFQGVISKDVLEKARSGVYADNAKNRRLKRVGQKYGSSGMDGKEGSDKTKEQEDIKEKPNGDRPLDEYAKETSETALQEAAKGGNEELRIAAKKELERREKEENISDQPEKENVSADTEKKPGEEKPPVSEKEKDESLTTEERQKNFKEWFGDSKVVDDNGNPLVVYHGTTGDFTEFNQSFDGGIWFTDSHEVADDFANANFAGDKSVLPVYLSMKNPMILDFKGDFLNDSKEVFEAVDAVNEFTSNKHDGVILKNVKDVVDKDIVSTVYLVLNSNQIKSATGNKGTFDAKSNDINKSVPNADDIQKSLLDELQDYKIKQLIAIADSSDISKATAARTILKEKLNL